MQGCFINIFKFSEISNIVIPFFEKHPIFGAKLLDYLDWCKVETLMRNPKSPTSHLTLEGLTLIRKIKSGMNTGRKV